MAVVAVAAVSVLTGLGAPSRVEASPQRPTNVPVVQACAAQPELVRGSSGLGVRCLQFTLIMLGYSVPYSGTFDGATEDAVRWYQGMHPPLDADGRAGDATLVAMGIAAAAAVYLPAKASTTGATTGASTGARTTGGSTPSPANVPATGRVACVADAQIDPGERGQSITCLQRRLTELGFYQGSITGMHDAPTQSAVRAFQKRTPPLTVDGVAGPRTLAALDIWSGLSVGNGRFTGPGPFPAPVQVELNWNLTTGGIPFYGNRKACTASEAAVIAAEFANDGADAATQQWAVYIASREGGCRPEAVNFNPRTKDDSHCTYQLNALSGTFAPHGELGRRGWTAESVKSSLQACADAASDLWVFCGRGPWVPPYDCKPPWLGATVGQPPALLPPPPTSVVVEPTPEPIPEPSPDTTPDTTADTTADTAATTTTTTATLTTATIPA